MIRRKEGLGNENKYSYTHPNGLFKQYFDVAPPVADTFPSIIKENAKRQVESVRKMRQMAKENSPLDVPKKADITRDNPLSPSLTTQRASSTSSSSPSLENHSQEMGLKLFLREMARGRRKCELIFGHKQRTDLSQPKQLGVEASTMPGCYKRDLNSTITRELDGWSEFVITYDNKFILNYSRCEIEESTVTGKHQAEFNHQTMGCGTFLKAAGKIRVLDNGKIVISPYSNYLELGWEYTPIILFVLREKGLPMPNENILIADEQGNAICLPTAGPDNKVRSGENAVPFYLNANRFPLAKAIAENKEVDVKGILSRLFLNIDDGILSVKNKKDIRNLITKKNQLKTAIINLLLVLIRNDLPNDLFKVVEPTIEAQFSEINKNSNLLKNKFGLSVKKVADETIYNNLCKINQTLELMKTKDGGDFKNIFDKIIRDKFLKINTNIHIQAEENNAETESEKKLEKLINEKLCEIKRNVESIKSSHTTQHAQIANLKELLDSVIYKSLCEVNESILSIKNPDNVTLKELTGKTARQNFCEVNEAIQLIKSSYGIDLNFVKNELDIWLHCIFNLKFQYENKLEVFEEKGEDVLSDVLKLIETNLKEMKAGSFPQRHINEHDLIRSPFIQFYSENPTKTCIALLRDYTKGGFFWRLLTGAWRRHHIKTVGEFLKEYDNQQYPDNLSIQAIYRELFDLKEGTLAEYTGKKSTLFARLLFCEKLENGSVVDSVVPIVNEAPRQSEILTNPGGVALNSVVEEASAIVWPTTISAPIPIKQPKQPINGMPLLASTYVSSPTPFIKENRDKLFPLPAPAVEEPTPPVAISSLKPGQLVV